MGQAADEIAKHIEMAKQVHLKNVTRMRLPEWLYDQFVQEMKHELTYKNEGPIPIRPVFLGVQLIRGGLNNE